MNAKQKVIATMGVALVATLIITALAMALTPVKPVNGVQPNSEPETITVYLGGVIHWEADALTTNIYFYHGQVWHVGSGNIDLIIGHWYSEYRTGGMSNILTPLRKGWTIHLGTRAYEIIDYGETWIKLEEIG